MTWGEPLWLRALAAPALAALLLLASLAWRRDSAEARWPGIRRVVAAGSRLLEARPGAARRRPWLLVLALALVIVALARPRWGVVEQPVLQQAREVMLALDLSRSMLVQDVPPDRLARARLLLQGLLDGLRGERVGLVVFAGTAFVQVPLSADYQILREFLPSLNPGYMPQGGTDFDGMLRAALGGFSDTAETDRYLVILSDGEALADSWRDRLPELKRRGVRVITLGVGTTGGGFIPDGEAGFVKDERGAVVLSRLETGTLRALASETGGAHRDAAAWVDLAALLQETVEAGRRGAFTDEKTVTHVERFQWFLGPALLVGMLGLWREVLVRPRPRSIRRPAAGPAARVAAGLLLLLSPAWSPRAVANEAPADESPAGQVRATIARLAAGARPGASEWRELADRTIAYGTATRSARRPIEPGAITDALIAVEMGRALEPLIADWDGMRRELEQFLDPPPPPPEPPPQDEPDPSEGDEDKEKNEEENAGENEGEPRPGESGSSADNESQGDPSDGEPSDPAEPKPGDEPRSGEREPPDRPAGDEGRLGEMNDDESTDPPPPEPPAAPPKTRKIGGRPADADTPPPSTPEMAAALQKLRQVTDGDSPARLFEKLEGERGPARGASGKDW